MKTNLNLFPLIFSTLFAAREKNDKKLFAFAFVRLMEAGGATLQDGQHELYIYKCEDRAKLESLSYLAMPSNAREPNYPGRDMNFACLRVKVYFGLLWGALNV